MELRSIRAQQEMAGFILIVLMIIIIGVILLGIFLRKGSEINVIDSEISNFLSASLKYTSTCAVDYEPNYKTVKELVEMCYGNANCLDNRNSCDALNNTYSGMISKFMPAGTIDYYKVGFYHQDSLNDSIARKPIASITSGNSTHCPIKRGGQAIYSASTGGYVFVELEICTGV